MILMPTVLFMLLPKIRQQVRKSTKITASSGLSEAEIQQAIRDAELHAEEDKKKRALIEAKNNGDNLIYQTENPSPNSARRVDGVTRGNIEAAINDLKEALKGDDTDRIVNLTNTLTQALTQAC